MATFDKLTPQKAKELLAEAAKSEDTLISSAAATSSTAPTVSAPQVNLAYYRGDHWQDGREWAGPRPTGGPDATLTLAKIREAFVSKNAIKECITRHQRAVIGGEPIWSFTVARPLGKVPKQAQQPQEQPAPTEPQPAATDQSAPPQPAQQPEEIELVDEQPNPEEQARIDETDVLTEWWDGGLGRKGALQILQEATATLLATGKATLRIWIPKRFLDPDSGSVSAPDLKTALERIAIQAPAYGQAGVYTDEETLETIGVYTSKDATEICYLDDDQMTVLGQAVRDGRFNLYPPMDLGGRLLIFQMECSPLITEQVRAQQRLLNMALTMLSRNVVQAGFLELILLNAQMPGKFVEDENGEKRFEPQPIERGPGVVNVLRGAKMEDDFGNVTYANPSAVWREPVSVDTFTNTRDTAYRGILEEVQQLYSLASGAFAISAESRRESRYDFLVSLQDTVTQVQEAGRWLLETVLALASLISGQAGRYNDLRAVFECRVDTGPIDASERSAIMDEVEAKLESREGAMVRLGRTDPDATLQQIASEQEKLQPPVDRVQLERAQLGLEQERAQADGQQQRLRAALEGDSEAV